MDEIVEIVNGNFEEITNRWAGTIGSFPKYFGSSQIPFFKSQITELLHCILDLLEDHGPSRLVKFTDRIVKPPYNGLLTLTTVHETFLLGEDAILSVVREIWPINESFSVCRNSISYCFS